MQRNRKVKSFLHKITIGIHSVYILQKKNYIHKNIYIYVKEAEMCCWVSPVSQMLTFAIC